jgi:hypothetical protein
MEAYPEPVEGVRGVKVSAPPCQQPTLPAINRDDNERAPTGSGTLSKGRGIYGFVFLIRCRIYGSINVRNVCWDLKKRRHRFASTWPTHD